MLDLRYRTILAVAIPLMGSSFIQSIVLLTDSSFLSRYDVEAFDASGNAGLIYISLFMLMHGLNDGLQIIIARRIGEGKLNQITKSFSSGIFMNLILAALLFVALHTFIPELIVNSVSNETIGVLETEYISMRSYGLFFSIPSLAINALLIAAGRTRIVMIGSLLTAVANILLDYLLIFGHWNLPEMGIEGAALASTLADMTSMIFLLAIVVRSKKKIGEFTLFTFSEVHLRNIKRITKISFPIMLQGLIALSTWTIFFFWLEQKGTFELTVSQNIRTIYFLAFVPIWGFAGTTKTYISQFLGRKDYDSIPIIIRRIRFLTILCLLMFFHGAILYPEELIKLINPSEVHLAKSAEVLQYVFGSVLLYGFSSVYFQAIAGSGNTRWSLIIEMLSVICYLLFAYLFIKIWNSDVFWIWTVEYIYFGVLGLASVVYLYTSNWKNKII